MAVKSNFKKKWQAFGRDESGAVAIITALCLIVLLGFLALVIDIGHVKAVRNELQNAADASALAGTRALFDVPAQPGESVIPISGPPNCTLGVSRAANTLNQSDAQTLSILNADIQTGNWDWYHNTFTPSTNCILDASGTPGINAVRVTVRRDSSANSPVNTWFARIWGTDTVDELAHATAAVGYVKGLGASSGGFPIAINDVYRQQQLDNFEGGSPLVPVTFSPDGTDVGGWCGPEDVGVNAALLKNWIGGTDPTGLPADISTGDSITLQNGNVDSAIQTLAKVLPSHTKTYNFTMNGTSYTFSGWLVDVPVVSVDKYNQNTTVVDFQPIIITAAQAQGTPKTISFVFYPGDVAVVGGESGGGPSGQYATQPKLVGQINNLY